MGLPPSYGFEHLKGSPRGAGLFLSSVIARCILYRRLGERRRGEISHGLYCYNSQNRALSLLLPSSPSIQAGLLAKAQCQSTHLWLIHRIREQARTHWFCGVFADLRVNKTAGLPRKTDGRPRGCLSGLLRYTARPSAGPTGLNSYNKPRRISRVACCFLTRLRAPREKRHDDECIGWRDHGLQVRLVHP